MLGYIILGLLVKKDMSGYDIKKELEISTSNFTKSSYGSIYPTLKKFLHENLVSLNEEQIGLKIKKIYSITDDGRNHFTKWMKSPIDDIQSFEQILARVFFFRFMEKEDITFILKQTINDLDVKIRDYESKQNYIQSVTDVYEYSTFRYGLGYLSYTRDWCQELLQSSM